jgi:glycosyltransferase involved in cell wall biosynthesis
MTFKVANIINTFNSKSGGPPRTVSLIAEAGNGYWKADLFTTEYREPAADTLLVKEFPGHVNVLPSGAHTILGGMAMMAGFSRAYRSQLTKGISPDLVHLHGMWNPFLAAFARTAKANRIPYIVAPHGMLEPWSLKVRALRKSLALKLYQGEILAHAAAIHATSDMEADNIRKLGLGSAPIFVVPNAVSAGPDLRPEDLPAPRSKKTLLFLSRIHEKKGIDLLIQAWNEIRPADWSLLIVGSGEPSYVERLRKYCTSHDVPEVEFRSHLEGVAREAAFRQASVFILPTYSENFGNVVAEALIRGVPVITTTGTPWREIVDKECGWYVDPTVDDVKAAILDAINTDSLALRQMGERGRIHVIANYTLPAVRASLLKMYRSALDSV